MVTRISMISNFTPSADTTAFTVVINVFFIAPPFLGFVNITFIYNTSTIIPMANNAMPINKIVKPIFISHSKIFFFFCVCAGSLYVYFILIGL